MTHENRKGGNAPAVLPKGFQPDRASTTHIGYPNYQVNNRACKVLNISRLKNYRATQASKYREKSQ